MSGTDYHEREFDLERDVLGHLVLVDVGGIRHVGVEAVRGFPISDPDHWISICDSKGRELATIKDLSALPPKARQALEEDLARREFVPVIRRIVGMPIDSEPSQWEVETDRGPTRFLVKSQDDVRRLGPQRALIVDSQGIRYLIDDLTQLDPASLRILERYL